MHFENGASCPLCSRQIAITLTPTQPQPNDCSANTGSDQLLSSMAACIVFFNLEIRYTRCPACTTPEQSLATIKKPTKCVASLAKLSFAPCSAAQTQHGPSRNSGPARSHARIRAHGATRASACDPASAKLHPRADLGPRTTTHAAPRAARGPAHCPARGLARHPTLVAPHSRALFLTLEWPAPTRTPTLHPGARRRQLSTARTPQ